MWASMSPSPSAPSRRALRHAFEGPELRRLLIEVAARTPASALRTIVPAATAIFHAAIPAARRAIEDNLEVVLGPAGPFERHRRSYRTFVHYAQSLAYLSALHAGAPMPVSARFLDRDRFERCFDDGQGVVTITAHFGAWQLMPYLLYGRARMPPVTMAMAEEPNRRLSELERKLRSKFNVIYTTGSPFVLLELQKVLRRGEVVGMQFDRQVGSGHQQVPFCGRPASFPTGAITLARLSRRPIVPIFSVYPNGDRARVDVHYEEPILVAHTQDRERDVAEALRRVVTVYERWVRAYPYQWFNFYDFWAPPSS
jgi:Kdo2-lipid IVA lauroyltransferase/acyltransferase